MLKVTLIILMNLVCILILLYIFYGLFIKGRVLYKNVEGNDLTKYIKVLSVGRINGRLTIFDKKSKIDIMIRKMKVEDKIFLCINIFLIQKCFKEKDNEVFIFLNKNKIKYCKEGKLIYIDCDLDYELCNLMIKGLTKEVLKYDPQDIKYNVLFINVAPKTKRLIIL